MLSLSKGTYKPTKKRRKKKIITFSRMSNFLFMAMNYTFSGSACPALRVIIVLYTECEHILLHIWDVPIDAASGIMKSNIFGLASFAIDCVSL